jgi:hypothetical protein
MRTERSEYSGPFRVIRDEQLTLLLILSLILSPKSLSLYYCVLRDVNLLQPLINALLNQEFLAGSHERSAYADYVRPSR